MMPLLILNTRLATPSLTYMLPAESTATDSTLPKYAAVAGTPSSYSFAPEPRPAMVVMMPFDTMRTHWST